MRRNQELDELNFGNACRYVPTELAEYQNFLPSPQRNCSTVGKGVLLNGLNAATQMYLQLAAAIVASIESTQGAPVPSSQTIDFDSTSALLGWWLPAAFIVETGMYFREQTESLDNFVELRTTLLAVFLSALALCFILIFEPLVREMDTHVKRVRALLVMIPAEVAMSTASLRKALLASV